MQLQGAGVSLTPPTQEFGAMFGAHVKGTLISEVRKEKPKNLKEKKKKNKRKAIPNCLAIPVSKP